MRVGQLALGGSMVHPLHVWRERADQQDDLAPNPIARAELVADLFSGAAQILLVHLRQFSSDDDRGFWKILPDVCQCRHYPGWRFVEYRRHLQIPELPELFDPFTFPA